jgi:hypothetical protein
MAIAAKISSSELTAQITNRFVGNSFEARLIDATGTTYEPGITDDASFLAFEVPLGTGGYQRQVIGYSSHVALVWSTGNASALGTVTTAPSAAVDGTYTNIPVDTTTGSGVGMTVDLTVTNSGAASTDYAVSIVSAGYDYAAADGIVFLEGTLAGLGIVSAGAGNLAVTINTVNTSSNAGEILSVAQTTSSVVLSGGNEAVFYWNLKQFGYYSV